MSTPEPHAEDRVPAKARYWMPLFLYFVALIAVPRGVASTPILISDDFSSGFDGWEVAAGTWRVERGELVGTGHGGGIDAWIYSGNRAWTDYSLSANVTFLEGEAEFVVRSTGKWENEYRIGIWHSPYMGQYHLQLARYRNGVVEHVLGDGIPSPVPITNPAHITVTAVGDFLGILVNDLLAFGWTDPDPLPSGRIGLGAVWSMTCRFDDVLVRDLTVSPVIPMLLAQPADQAVPAGMDAVFEAYAVGEAPLAYDWRFNGSSLVDGARLSGTRTRTLRIEAVAPEDAGTYSVIVRNAAGSVQSSNASLVVHLRPPEITTQPAPQTVLSGTPATFTAAGTGSPPLSWQWQRNGDDLTDDDRVAGAQTPSLTIAAVRIEDLGVYTVVIRNAYGEVISAPATLTATLQPPVLDSGPEDQSIVGGHDASFTVTASGSLPLSYQWQRNGVELRDTGRISGSQTETLRVEAAEAQDLGQYAVTVGNAYGWTVSRPALLTMTWAPPNITDQPRGQRAALGTTVSLRVITTGSLPMNYQWQRSGIDLVDDERLTGSRTSVLTISELRSADLGEYSVLVANAFGRLQSTSVPVTTSSVELRIQRRDGWITVSWDEAAKGATLQTASQLGSPDWRNVEGSEFVVSMGLHAPQQASAFFRLVRKDAPFVHQIDFEDLPAFSHLTDQYKALGLLFTSNGDAGAILNHSRGDSGTADFGSSGEQSYGCGGWGLTTLTFVRPAAKVRFRAGDGDPPSESFAIRSYSPDGRLLSEQRHTTYAGIVDGGVDILLEEREPIGRIELQGTSPTDSGFQIDDLMFTLTP